MKKPQYIPFLTTSITEDLCLAILLIPLWWILGIKFLIFQLIAFLALIKLLAAKPKKSEKIIFPAENYFLLIFVILYLFSILINLKNIPFPRLLASLNNLSFWIMGLLIIFVIYNSIRREDILTFLRTFLNFGIICSIFVLPFFVLSTLLDRYFRTETLLSKLLPDKFVEGIIDKAPLLQSSFQPVIVGGTKIFGITFPRAVGFNVYSTALGGTMLFLIVMTLAYYKTKKRKTGLAVILTIEAITLFFSLSRMPVLALFLAWMIASIIIIKKSLLLKILPIVLTVLIITSLLIPLDKIIYQINKARKMSLRLRGELYKVAFFQVLEKPLLGSGFKPRTDEFYIPIGSHSTYVGVLYKTGFLGFCAFILFWISVLRKWWSQRESFQEHETLKHMWFYSGIAIIAGLFWMVAEDLDAPPIVAFIYFIITGFTLSLDKIKKTPSER